MPVELRAPIVIIASCVHSHATAIHFLRFADKHVKTHHSTMVHRLSNSTHIFTVDDLYILASGFFTHWGRCADDICGGHKREVNFDAAIAALCFLIIVACV